MRLFSAFLQLIRLPNLIFIIITQSLFYFCIMRPSLGEVNATPAIGIIAFIVLTLASVFIAAAGYIINDYFDINIDQVNKPDKNVVDKIVSRRWAMLWHFVLSGTGIIASFIVSWKTGLWYIVLVNTVCVFALFGYSVSLKRKLLTGNILISLLTAWVVLVLCFSQLHPFRGYDLLSGIAERKIIRIGLLYAGFAFIISLIREAIKDMEDVEGDARYGSRTMPIVWGMNASKIYISIWLSVLLIMLLITQAYVLEFFHWWWAALYTVLLVLSPLIYLFIQLFKSNTAQQYHRLSTFSKYIMLTGICSMLFFYFYL